MNENRASLELELTTGHGTIYKFDVQIDGSSLSVYSKHALDEQGALDLANRIVSEQSRRKPTDQPVIDSASKDYIRSLQLRPRDEPKIKGAFKALTEQAALQKIFAAGPR